MITTYRQALLSYSICFVMLWGWLWVSDNLLIPVCHAQINGTQYLAKSLPTCEQRKLADYEEEFLPEIVNQQTLPHTGFMVTRNELNEFGRQAKHITGNTPANLYTWVLMQIIYDPYQILATQSLSLLYLFGVWVLLISRALEIQPTAGLFATLSGVATPFLVYWLTFPMHIATVCWTAGLVYGMIRSFREPDGWGWLVLAFATYGLFLMGYPQTAVYSVWMLVGYAGVMIWLPLQQGQWRDVARQLGFMASAVVSGAALTLPAYIDLYVRYRDSSRFWVKDEFFLQAIQSITSITDVMLYAVSRFVPELYGNPLEPTYPLEFDGANVPLLTGVCVVMAIIYQRQATKWWLVCMGWLWALTVSATLFTFVMHLLPGLRFSAWTPAWSAVVPMVLVVAYGSDALLRLPVTTVRRVVGWLIVAHIAVVGCGFVVAEWFSLPIGAWDVARVSLVVLSMFGLYWRPSARMLWGALFVTIAVTAAPLFVQQPRSALVKATPLTQTLQQHVPSGARFAVVAPALEYLLAPNYNAVLGVASVHSYNNFFTAYYQRLINRLGGKITVYGKLNRAIAPNYDDTTFWMSNIAVVLATQPIEHANLQLAAHHDDVLVYRVKQRMGQFWRIPVQRVTSVSDIHIPNHQVPQTLPITQYEHAGDVVQLRYPVAATQSLIVLSTLYETGWQAESFDGRKWQKIAPVSVNGSFLGVVVPAQSQALTVRYVTYAEYMWISHLIWLVGVIAVGVWQINRTRRTQK